MTETDAARIGVFGGTFDPPHIGHVAVAADVADFLHLDRVLWVPVCEPPHKPGGAASPAALRMEMVEEAVRSDSRFEMSALEIERGGPSYTVETLRSLRETLPDAELYLIMGVDQFRGFDSWREPAEIVRLARLAVMDREGESARAFAGDVPGGGEAIVVPVRRVDVSSTGVREALREGREVSAWLPPGVAAVIEREGLYSTA